MPLPGILVEAHSYSGGLRHTLFGEGAGRPPWTPPVDSVGWRDDFEIGERDTVVEFNQRLFDGRVVSWLAVYRRSIDAQFGDRSNHAGLGVWLCDLRIADARSLLIALESLATVLAQHADPREIESGVEKLVSERYLGSYLVSAQGLPRAWRGAQPSAATLVDTSFGLVVAPGFAAGVDRVAERVTRLSLGWQSADPPRTVILVTERTPPSGRTFEELEAPGAFLVDVLEQIPEAFAAEQSALRAAEAGLEQARAQWDRDRDAQQRRLDADRRDWERLEGHPATMEGIATRLNGLSRQIADLRDDVGPGRVPARRDAGLTAFPEPAGTPATRSAAAAASKPPRSTTLKSSRPTVIKPSGEPREASLEMQLGTWVLGTSLLAALVVLAVLLFWMYR